MGHVWLRSQTLSVLVTLGSMLSACGSSNNFNQIWGRDDEAGDSLITEARLAYDRGDFDAAENLTSKLLTANPDNEDAAVLLGYVYLSKGGIDPFRLARELIALSDNDSTGPAAALALSDEVVFEPDLLPLQSPGATNAGSSASDASSTLSKLGTLINLVEADFQNLQTSRLNEGLFADSPIIIPATVSDELRSKVNVLSQMDKAIKAICRYVDTSTKVEEEARHTGANCTQVNGYRENAARAHFLWAFAHLTEALVYQSVLLYNSVGTSTSNFQFAVDKINGQTFTNADGFSDFVSQVDQLNSAVDSVFDTANKESMISATLRSLDAVNKSFAAMPGLPESLTKRITSALAKIEDVAAQLGNAAPGSSTLSNKTKALKGQMTEKFSKTIGSKIDSAVKAEIKKITGTDAAKAPTSEELDKLPIEQSQKDLLKANITKMCGSYTTLSEGMSPEQVAASKPQSCQ